MTAQPAIKEKTIIKINREWCKGCGICVSFCPEDVLGLDDNEKAFVMNPEKCVSCGMCELRCPDMAIELTEADP